MRQKHRILCWFSLLIIAAVPICHAKNPMADWRGVGTINVSGNQRYKAVFLTPAIYRSAQTDLSDIRLLDAENHPVPYIIQNANTISNHTEDKFSSVLLRNFKKNNSSFFDFKIEPIKNDTDTAGNLLRVALPNEDFLKNVRYFGSYDGDSWDYLGSGSFYRVNGLVKDELTLNSRLKYNYYRIELIDDVEGLQIGDLQLIDEHGFEEWTRLQKNTTLSFLINQKDNYTFITLKNPNRLKVNRINLQTEGYFKRRFEVHDQQGNTIPVSDPWIYQFSFKEMEASQTQIQFTDYFCNSHFMVIKVYNQNDRPIKIKSIQVSYARDKLIFEGRSGQAYRLYFGNPKAAKPNYDMELFRDPILKEEHDIQKIEGINIEVQPSKEPLPRNTLVLIFNCVLGLTALIMAFILIKRLKP